MRVDQDGQLRLAEHVNEAWRDDHAGGIDVLCGPIECRDDADFSDVAVANSDVARVPGRTGTVDDMAVMDDEVKHLRRHREQREREKHDPNIRWARELAFPGGQAETVLRQPNMDAAPQRAVLEDWYSTSPVRIDGPWARG